MASNNLDLATELLDNNATVGIMRSLYRWIMWILIYRALYDDKVDCTYVISFRGNKQECNLSRYNGNSMYSFFFYFFQNLIQLFHIIS